MAGGAQGEGGVGLELATSGRYMAGEMFWTMTLGLSVRLPLVGGVIAGIVNPLALAGRGGGSGRSSQARGSGSGGSGSGSGGGGGGVTPRAGVPTR